MIRSAESELKQTVWADP